MIIALSGSHRTGKTTLTKAYAERHPVFTQVSVSISSMQAEIGYQSSIQNYGWEIRRYIQSHLLKSFTRLIVELDKSSDYILDRSPLDLIVYLLKSVPQHPSQADSDFILDYIKQCIELNNLIDTTVVLQPGIPLVSADTSAPAVASDLELYTFILLGLLTNTQYVHKSLIRRLPRSIINLDERVAYVGNLVTELNYSQRG